MSLKSDDVPYSITAVLTTLFTISTSLLLLIVVAILYEAIAGHLDEEHEHLLGEIVRVIQHTSAARGGDVSSLVGQLRGFEETDQASYADPYEVRVVNRQGVILAQSRGMEDIPPAAYAGMRPAGADERPQARRWTSAKGTTFLLAAIASSEAGGGSVIHVALDVTRDRVLMGQLRTTAAFLLVLALVAAALAGSAVVRFSLRPVSRIASEVAAVSAKDLGQRLSLEDRPRELRSLVRAFNTMLDRLARAFAGLSEYSENLAHELRTPLNNLKGEAEVALLHERKPEEYREVLMSSLEEYNRLTTMTDGLLFLARAESRATKPAWSVTDLGEISRAVCEFYEGVAEEKQATLTAVGSASANVDPVLVRRAVANLVANALHHIAGGGHVNVSVRPTDDGGASVEVADDGSGIAEPHLVHVTERFYRTPETRSRGVQGSGLGLAIVKSIMDLHGGSIAIDSAAGRGTTVTLLFPPSA